MMFPEAAAPLLAVYAAALLPYRRTCTCTRTSTGLGVSTLSCCCTGTPYMRPPGSRVSCGKLSTACPSAYKGLRTSTTAATTAKPAMGRPRTSSPGRGATCSWTAHATIPSCCGAFRSVLVSLRCTVCKTSQCISQHPCSFPGFI